jgi:hypothetical protein
VSNLKPFADFTIDRVGLPHRRHRTDVYGNLWCSRTLGSASATAALRYGTRPARC